MSSDAGWRLRAALLLLTVAGSFGSVVGLMGLAMGALVARKKTG